MCLCRENISSLRETVKVLAEAGCSALKTQCSSPQGLWANQKEHFLTYDETLQAYLDYIPQYAEDKAPIALQLEGFFSYDPANQTYVCLTDKSLPEGHPVPYTGLPVCSVVHTSFYLGPSGNVVPCMSLDYIELTSQFPNVYDMPLQQILSESSFTQAMSMRVKDVLDHTAECRECEHRSRCCGGCRAFAAVEHPNDYLAMDSVACKILKEGWDQKLYEVGDRYFKRAERKSPEEKALSAVDC